jgi:hypothetical protein
MRDELSKLLSFILILLGAIAVMLFVLPELSEANFEIPDINVFAGVSHAKQGSLSRISVKPYEPSTGDLGRCYLKTPAFAKRL